MESSGGKVIRMVPNLISLLFCIGRKSRHRHAEKNEGYEKIKAEFGLFLLQVKK